MRARRRRPAPGTATTSQVRAASARSESPPCVPSESSPPRVRTRPTAHALRRSASAAPLDRKSPSGRHAADLRGLRSLAGFDLVFRCHTRAWLDRLPLPLPHGYGSGASEFTKRRLWPATSQPTRRRRIADELPDRRRPTGKASAQRKAVSLSARPRSDTSLRLSTVKKRRREQPRPSRLRCAVRGARFEVTPGSPEPRRLPRTSHWLRK
jgi:hypothetical protein